MADRRQAHRQGYDPALQAPARGYRVPYRRACRGRRLAGASLLTRSPPRHLPSFRRMWSTASRRSTSSTRQRRRCCRRRRQRSCCPSSRAPPQCALRPRPLASSTRLRPSDRLMSSSSATTFSKSFARPSSQCPRPLQSSLATFRLRYSRCLTVPPPTSLSVLLRRSGCLRAHCPSRPSRRSFRASAPSCEVRHTILRR